MESPVVRVPTRQSQRIAQAYAKSKVTEASSSKGNEYSDPKGSVQDDAVDFDNSTAGMFVNVDLKVDVNPEEFYDEDSNGDANDQPLDGASRAKAIVAKLAQKLNSKLNAEFTPRSPESLLACLEPEVSVATEGTITSGSVYVCPWCPLTSSLPEAIEEHKKLYHPAPTGEPQVSPQSPHICEVCGKSFARSWHLKRHFIIHSGERPFICVDCGDTFVTAGDLSFHHQKDHTPFSCKLCPEVFEAKGHLKLHMKIHRSESGRLWRCFVCDKRYDSRSVLIAHQSTHGMLTSIMKGFCRKCGKSFKSVVDLENHIKSNTCLFHACPLCNKSFKQINTLTDHMRNIHKVELPGKTGKMSALFVCLQCQREFDNILSLKQHLRMHSWAKPCKCPECGDSFRGANDLKVHMRIHTGERPFQCPICGERFTQKGNLNVHIRTHTGEKPFECQICGRCFLKSSNLKEHHKVHQDKGKREINQEEKVVQGMGVQDIMAPKKLSEIAQESKSFRESIAGKLMKTGITSLSKEASDNFKRKIANKLMKTGFVPQNTAPNNFGDTIAERLMKAGSLSFDNGNISLRLL